MTQPATAAPTDMPTGMPSPKQQYADVYSREHQTTLKVLKAFPDEEGGYKPHDRSKSAIQLAWTFVVENNVAHAALKGPLDLGSAFPQAPPSLSDVVAAYEKSAKELLSTLARTPDSRFFETV